MRLRYLAPVLSAILLSGGCDGYERTNPLDPDYRLELTIVGPDTIYSINDTIQFEAVTEPSHPDLALAWTSSDVVRLQPVSAAPGEFTSLANGVATVSVEYGPHRAEKQVVISQQAVRLLIAPPPVTELESLGEVVNLTAAIVDGKNTPVSGAAADLVWSASDPAVADVSGGGRVTARSNGESWIKASSLGQADSVHILVRQRPDTMYFSRSDYTIGVPGGSVQTALVVRDAKNNLIAAPDGLTFTSSRPTLFHVTPAGLVVSRDAYGSTEITARLGGMEARTGVRVTGGTRPLLAGVRAGLTALDTPGAPRDFLLVEVDARDAEADLDRARIDVFSIENPLATHIVTRTIPLEQGRAIYPGWLVVQDVPSAGSVRVQIEDAANNSSPAITSPSCNCQATVTAQPRTGAPDVTVVSASRSPGDSLDVRLTATAGQASLTAVYLVGFDASWDAIFSHRTSLEQPAGTSANVHIGTRTSEASRVARIGVLISDASGNLSLVRTFTLSAGSAAATRGVEPVSSGAAIVQMNLLTLSARTVEGF